MQACVHPLIHVVTSGCPQPLQSPLHSVREALSTAKLAFVIWLELGPQGSS